MPDVTDNAWIWDGTSKNTSFGKFEDKGTERLLPSEERWKDCAGVVFSGRCYVNSRIIGFILQPSLEYVRRLEIGIDKADRLRLAFEMAFEL
jgi:hypothetical protein